MPVDQLTSVFSALADPTRRAILARLADGDLTVKELRAPFPFSQPAISKHLKVLESAGLISRSRRRTERLSHLEAEPLRDATAWLARYQAFWDERFEQLDELLVRVDALGLRTEFLVELAERPLLQTAPVRVEPVLAPVDEVRRPQQAILIRRRHARCGRS